MPTEKHGAHLNEAGICPVCFRDYAYILADEKQEGDSGFPFCTSEDCPSHPDYKEDAPDGN